MPDEPTPNLSQEIRRRLRENYKRSLYFVVPFALTTLGAWAHAPTPLVIACFWAIWVGLVIWMVSYYRLSRCPACHHFLAYLFQSPPVYRQCPYCHAPFQPDRA